MRILGYIANAPACAHQGHKLDYLQGPGRLTRPPRDGSFRIHPSPDTFGRAHETMCEAYSQSQVLAGCLPPDGSPSFSILRPRNTGSIPLGRLVPAQLGSGSGPGPRVLGSRSIRLGQSGCASGTYWLDSSVVGPGSHSARLG